jgi:hypothetical protein
VIFSDPDVINFVRDRFVPAWESVRAVPKISVDFGNGVVHERTLTGNVATLICTPEGKVVDILPGLSDPASYVRDLKRALELYESGRDVAEYHRTAVDPASAKSDDPLAQFAEYNRKHRKPKVHAMLAEGPTTPAEIRWRLFRDILDVKMDDPYLGVIDALDAIEGGPHGHP